MMIVPEHWAEARRQHRAGGKQLTVRRFGWSDTTPADAEAMAAQRADEALARLLRGEPLDRRERKVAYNGAHGLPIREEVLARYDEEVVTRNAYGARCLNSPRLLFADVDFPAQRPGRTLIHSILILTWAALLSGMVTGRSWAGFWPSVVLLVCLPSVWWLLRRHFAMHGGGEAVTRRKLARFLADRADWNVGLYQTPAGLRLVATHRAFDPLEPEVQAFFRALGTDKIYVRMCLNQRCFRARLSAKPWRIGIASHLRPRPGVWPVAPAQLGQRAAWVAAYEAKAAGFAACRFLDSVGSGTVDANLALAIALHDSECRAHDTACPIA